MTIEQKMVEAFMAKAGQNSRIGLIGQGEPSSIDERRLRAKLIFEECLETIHKGLGIIITSGGMEVELNIDELDFEVPREDNGVDLVELADGLADLHYVAYCGTAVTFGIDMEPIFEEVHASNMSKFIDGHRRDDGKWIKGPSYREADIKNKLALQIANASLNAYLISPSIRAIVAQTPDKDTIPSVHQ